MSRAAGGWRAVLARVGLGSRWATAAVMAVLTTAAFLVVSALIPDGEGSTVTITERGEIYNPVFRSLARFMFGYTSTMDKTLDALERA